MLNTRRLVYAALFAAVTAALGLLIIPLYPVPVTGQSMGPMLAGSILGSRTGALSLIVFDLLAAAGIPVLSGGRGGLGIILGPTGGYILSWPVAAYVIGKIVECRRNKNLLLYIIANIVGGIAVVYAVGVPWLAVQQGLDIKTAFIEGALIFLPGDMVKVIVASIAAQAVSRVFDAGLGGS
ncbi:MAG: biotin transporter BioY [Clostridia bacterium]|nr:biotin transporter BioY [Clostridia bacterium]